MKIFKNCKHLEHHSRILYTQVSPSHTHSHNLPACSAGRLLCFFSALQSYKVHILHFVCTSNWLKFPTVKIRVYFIECSKYKITNKFTPLSATKGTLKCQIVPSYTLLRIKVNWSRYCLYEIEKAQTGLLVFSWKHILTLILL